jgi:hypothetical protein
VRWIYRGWGPRSGASGYPHKRMSTFLDPDQKLLPTMLDFEEKMPFHSSRPLVHIAHIECTLSSRSKIQYICSLPLREQAINWVFTFEVNPSIKHIINLEVKNITKPSLAQRL